MRAHKSKKLVFVLILTGLLTLAYFGITDNVMFSHTEHPLVNGTNSKHPLVNGTNAEHPLVNGTNSKYPLVNGNNAEHPLVNGTNSEHPLVNGNNAEHPLVNGTNSEHPLINGTNVKHPLEHPLVNGTKTEHPLVNGTNAGQDNKTDVGKTHLQLEQLVNNILQPTTSPEPPFCQNSSTQTYYSVNKRHSNRSDWTYKAKTMCPESIINDKMLSKKRLKLSLKCNENDSVKAVTSWTDSPHDISSFDFGDPCLRNYICTCCTDDKPVPNVVHYVWYKDGEIDFVTFVSFISVLRFIKPCLILIIGEFVPRGKYWNYIVNIYPNIIHVYRTRPLSISGKRIKFHEHSGDVMRIDSILEYGGIYLDTDTVLVRPIEALRKYVYTGSRQPSGYLLNAFMMGERNATFLNLWLDGYRYDYKNDSYTYNSMTYPNKLAYNHARSGIIHIELGTISRPKGQIGYKIYDSNCDWSSIYGIHLYKRIYRQYVDENAIKTLNTTFGSIFRHILFGNKDLCTK